MSKGNHREYSSIHNPEIIVVDDEFEKEEKKCYLKKKNSAKKRSALPKKRIQKRKTNKTDMKIKSKIILIFFKFSSECSICLSNMILKNKDIRYLFIYLFNQN